MNFHLQNQEYNFYNKFNITLKNFENIWKLKTRNKLKEFEWKILNNSLPIKKNLKNTDTLCSFCNNVESIDHLFYRM